VGCGGSVCGGCEGCVTGGSVVGGWVCGSETVVIVEVVEVIVFVEVVINCVVVVVGVVVVVVKLVVSIVVAVVGVVVTEVVMFVVKFTIVIVSEVVTVVGLLFSTGVIFLSLVLWQAKSKINTISNKTVMEIAIIRFGCFIITLPYLNYILLLLLYHKNLTKSREILRVIIFFYLPHILAHIFGFNYGFDSFFDFRHIYVNEDFK
jgi:hypothetical protein